MGYRRDIDGNLIDTLRHRTWLGTLGTPWELHELNVLLISDLKNIFKYANSNMRRSKKYPFPKSFGIFLQVDKLEASD